MPILAHIIAFLAVVVAFAAGCAKPDSLKPRAVWAMLIVAWILAATAVQI